MIAAMPVDGFDVTDADDNGVVLDAEDDITQKHDVPDETMSNVRTAKVVDAFDEFWPDHSLHELIGQTMSAGEIVLTCTECDLTLHVPATQFLAWLTKRK